MKDKTLVIGASDKPQRYSHMAAVRLKEHDHEIILYGRREGVSADETIRTEWENWEGVDTVTMYVAPNHQPELYERIMELNPRRVIFNPSTENSEFAKMLRDEGILVENACTLVLLSIGNY